MMRPDDGRVDHLHALADARGLVEGVEQDVPQPGQVPSPELSVDLRPFAETLMQVTPLRARPGDPENSIENKAMVLGPSTAMRAANRHERLKARPFLIRHQSPNQARLP